MPAGTLVLAIAWGRVGPSIIPTGDALWIAGVLLVLGVIFSITLSLGWSAAVLRRGPGLEEINGGWLIPAAMNLLVPLALVPLIAANPGAAPVLLLVGFAFYGIGTILFVIILALLVARLALRGPLPPAMAPSLWIPLAPAGMLGAAMLRMLQAATDARIPGFTGTAAGLVVTAMGLGFGLWWAAFAWIELQRMRTESQLTAHPGWWGFVFPVAAIALSISGAGAATGIVAVQWAGLLATVVLTCVWAYVSAQTAHMLRHRRTA